MRSKFRESCFRSAGIVLLACFMTAGAPAQSSDTSSTPKTSSASKSTAHKSRKATGKASASSKGKSGAHSSGHLTGASSKRSSRKKKPRGQQAIDPERARSIQEALIREHYLTGEPAGTWNQESEAAMRRYQADHGWQSKTVPDSRALISLGLGPSKDHLLNPESAMTSGPESPRAESLPASSQPAAPVSSSPMPTPGGVAPSRPQ